MALEAEVRAQKGKFLDALPSLLETHAGKWVAYQDGVKHVADDRMTAYAWAVKNLPRERGFVVTQVVRQEPAYASAAFGLGLRR